MHESLCHHRRRVVVIARLGHVPTRVRVALAAGDDTGVSDTDRLTRIDAPAWKVVVNKPGMIRLDIGGNGTIDAELEATAPGGFTFPGQFLGEGVHTVRAELEPLLGEAAGARMVFEIDTTSPGLLGGAPTEQAPLYRRALVFSEPVDATALTVDSLSLLDPSGGVISPTGVTGGEGGAAVELGFSALIQPGQYEVLVPAGLTDLAGNPLADSSEPVSNPFELLPDTESPRVADVSPAGLRAAPVDVVQIAFSEELQVDSFQAADVRIEGPLGPIERDGVELLSHSTTRFEISGLGLDMEGDYLLEIGPEIRDLAGNPMTAAAQATVTIDWTGPHVAAVAPQGTVGGPLEKLVFEMSEPVRLDTLRQSAVLEDPSGAQVAGVQVNSVEDRVYEVVFPRQNQPGDYTFRIDDRLVGLTTEPAGHVELLAEVTLDAGQQGARVPLRPLDGGNATVRIDAEAGGYAVASATLEVFDQQRPGLTLSAPGGIWEEGTTRSLIVSRTGASGAEIDVFLHSSWSAAGKQSCRWRSPTLGAGPRKTCSWTCRRPSGSGWLPTCPSGSNRGTPCGWTCS